MEMLIAFIPAVVALMVVPGPDMAYCVASGVSYGKRGAFFSALGVGLGGMVLTVVTAGLIFAAHGIDARLTLAIQAGGCLYLLYLSAKIIAARHSADGEGVQVVKATERQMIMRGIITNISNPKALVFFLSFIPQFIPAAAENPAFYAIWLGMLLCAIGVTMNFGFGLIGTVASPLDRIVVFERSLGQILISVVFFVVAIGFLVNIIREIAVPSLMTT